MQQIFSQQIRFKADDGSDYPEWEEKKLGEVVESLPTKKYQLNSSKFEQFGLYPVIDQGSDFIAGYSNDESLVFSNTPVIVFGDHTTILKYVNFSFVIGADGTKVLKPKPDYNEKYVFYSINFNNVKQEGYKRHFTILQAVLLQLPCLEEQTKIANFLSAIDSKIEQVAQQLEAAKQFKKGLLQQMFV